MSTINRLSSVDALQPGDLIPVWDGSNGDTRKASLTTLLAFIESNFADPDYSTRIVAPNVDGFNVDIGNTGDSFWLIVNPVLNYTTGSITLPSTTYAVNDQEITLVFTAQVSSFSITGAGATVLGAPTQIRTYDSFRVRYNAAQLTWYTLDTTDFVPLANTLELEYTSQLGTTSVVGAATGYVVRTNYYDANVTAGSGATFKFTGTSTLGKAGNVPDADGYFYDADGKQFAVVGPKSSIYVFGVTGDGSTDDTAAFNAALASGVSTLIAGNNDTIILDGGSSSTTANFQFIGHGSTFKLKNSATLKTLLSLFGANSSVVGGTWDGNKANGNSTGSQYSQWNVGLRADNCSVTEITSINTYGMAVFGGSDFEGLTASRNNISSTDLYGIFFSVPSTKIVYNNKACGNIIDVTDGGNIGQAILFTSTLATGFWHSNWEVSDNRCLGGLSVTGDQAICLGVRGHRGVFANNTTRGGSMGISEGGDNTVFSGNIITELSPNGTGFGIEPSGVDNVITGNIIRDSKVGISASGSFSRSAITGNIIESVDVCIKIQATQVGKPGENVIVSGNTILATARGIIATDKITGLTVSGNNFNGPGSGVNQSRGVYIETPSALAANVNVIGNHFKGFQRAYAIFAATALTYTNLNAIGNAWNDVGGTGWNAEGSAILGAYVSDISSSTSAGGQRQELIEQGALNVREDWTAATNRPEGGSVAGVGSMIATINTGERWIKISGTGNTGWALLYYKRLGGLSDADASFNAGAGSPSYNILTLPLTATRTITLGTPFGVWNGASFVFTRAASSTGAFNLNIGGLKNLATGEWCEVMYNGSAWVLVSFGSL
jgi:hypothetical protein